MNTIPDLIPLYDNRPGLRTLLQVEVREPRGDEVLQEEAEEAEKTGSVSQKETKETESEGRCWISSPARRRWTGITRSSSRRAGGWSLRPDGLDCLG